MPKTISIRFKNTPEDQAIARAFLEAQREKMGETEKIVAFVDSLPDRLLRVLELIAIGHQPRAIATELGISTATVRNYRDDILRRARSRGLSCADSPDLTRVYRVYSESDRPYREARQKRASRRFGPIKRKSI